MEKRTWEIVTRVVPAARLEDAPSRRLEQVLAGARDKRRVCRALLYPSHVRAEDLVALECRHAVEDSPTKLAVAVKFEIASAIGVPQVQVCRPPDVRGIAFPEPAIAPDRADQAIDQARARAR